jgi:hypothetical protein
MSYPKYSFLHSFSFSAEEPKLSEEWQPQPFVTTPSKLHGLRKGYIVTAHAGLAAQSCEFKAIPPAFGIIVWYRSINIRDLIPFLILDLRNLQHPPDRFANEVETIPSNPTPS